MRRSTVFIAILSLFLLAPSLRSQIGSDSRQQGKIVEFHANGKAHWIYQIDASDRVLVIRGGRGPEYQVGQEISFRVEKSHVFIQVGKKEKEYRLLQTEAKR